jgi:hypothetical protein
MPFLHLPVQSGSDRVLKAMNRSHTAASYLRILERVRAVRPDIALSGDFIVGFPGETEAEFEETLSLVDAVGYAQCFSFKYSARPGTPAADDGRADRPRGDGRAAAAASGRAQPRSAARPSTGRVWARPATCWSSAKGATRARCSASRRGCNRCISPARPRSATWCAWNWPKPDPIRSAHACSKPCGPEQVSIDVAVHSCVTRLSRSLRKPWKAGAESGAHPKGPNESQTFPCRSPGTSPAPGPARTAAPRPRGDRIRRSGHPGALFGQFDANLVHIENRLGVYISARGNRVQIEGPEDAVARARDVLKAMHERLRRAGPRFGRGRGADHHVCRADAGRHHHGRERRAAGDDPHPQENHRAALGDADRLHARPDQARTSSSRSARPAPARPISRWRRRSAS